MSKTKDLKTDLNASKSKKNEIFTKFQVFLIFCVIAIGIVYNLVDKVNTVAKNEDIMRCNPLQRKVHIGDVEVGGVFAGNDLSKGEQVSVFPTLLLSTEGAFQTIFMHYLFGFNETHNLFMLGAGSMFNHSKKPNVKSFMMVYNETKPMPAYRQQNVEFVSLEDTQRGTQLFVFYGEEIWFTERKIELVDLGVEPPLSHDELFDPEKVLPGCPLNFRVDGDSLYATRSFEKDEIVEVSNVFLFSFIVAENEPISQLFWINPNGQNEVFFNGITTLARTSTENANIEYSWYDEDAPCASTMYVQITAKRNIEAGEELFLDIESVEKENGFSYRMADQDFMARCFDQTSS